MIEVVNLLSCRVVLLSMDIGHVSFIASHIYLSKIDVFHLLNLISCSFSFSYKYN